MISNKQTNKKTNLCLWNTGGDWTPPSASPMGTMDNSSKLRWRKEQYQWRHSHDPFDRLALQFTWILKIEGLIQIYCNLLYKIRKLQWFCTKLPKQGKLFLLKYYRHVNGILLMFAFWIGLMYSCCLFALMLGQKELSRWHFLSEIHLEAHLSYHIFLTSVLHCVPPVAAQRYPVTWRQTLTSRVTWLPRFPWSPWIL